MKLHLRSRFVVLIETSQPWRRFPVVLTPASMESEEGGVAQPLLQACFVCQPAGAQGQVSQPPILLDLLLCLLVKIIIRKKIKQYRILRHRARSRCSRSV